MSVDFGTVSTAFKLANAAKKGLDHVRRLQPEYGPFWKAFAARAEPQAADVPWPLIRGWRLDPEFIEAACRLMRGERPALDRLCTEFFARAAAERPAASRLSAEEVVQELQGWARAAAAEAMRRYPVLLQVAQTNMVEGHVSRETERLSRELAELAERLEAGRGPTRRKASPPVEAGRIADVAAADGIYRLGVKPAAEPGPYVRRDIDERLRETLADIAARAGCVLVVVEGPARAGKTRTLLEAAVSALPDAWLFAPPDGAALAALARRTAAAETGYGACVVWLGEIERFAGEVNRGLSRSTIRAFQKWNRPVLLLGTALAGNPLLGGNLLSDRFSRVAAFELPGRLSGEELQRVVDARYPADSARRIAEEGIGAYMTQARRLVDRFERGDDCPEGVAVTRAACDWRRAGLLRPVPASCLERLHGSYLARRPTPEGFRRGLEWATTPLPSGLALLAGRETYEVDGCVVEHCAQRHPIEPATWDAVIDEYAGADELAFQVGLVATRLGDLDRAERAFRRADQHLHPVGALHLGVLLERRGDVDAAEAAYRRADERGEPNGANNLGLLLQKRLDFGGAEAAFAMRTSAAPERAHGVWACISNVVATSRAPRRRSGGEPSAGTKMPSSASPGSSRRRSGLAARRPGRPRFSRP